MQLPIQFGEKLFEAIRQGRHNIVHDSAHRTYHGKVVKLAFFKS